MSQDLENSEDSLRLLQVIQMSFIYPNPTRAYSLSSIHWFPIVQTTRLIPLEQPNCQFKGLLLELLSDHQPNHSEFSPLQSMWMGCPGQTHQYNKHQGGFSPPPLYRNRKGGIWDQHTLSGLVSPPFLEPVDCLTGCSSASNRHAP